MKDQILPLVWYEVGSVREVLDLSVLMIRGLVEQMNVASMQEQYQRIKGIHPSQRGFG